MSENNNENQTTTQNQSEKNKPAKKQSLLKSGLVLSLMTFASRIMGLVRERTRATFLGTSMYADVFSTAFQIPNLLRRLFAENSISVAFIPTFKDYLEKGDDDESRKNTQEFLKATFTLITFLTTLVVIIGIIIIPLLMPLFCEKPVDTTAATYAQQLEFYFTQKKALILLTRIMWPYLTVISIAALFQGILNGCKIFAPSGFTPVLFNGTVIAVTYIGASRANDPAVAAKVMAFGTVIGGCIQALFQLPFVLKTGWKVGFTTLKKTFSNPGTKRVLKLIGPTIIGMAAYQLNDLVSTSFAMRAGEGVASSLQYSLRLQELILGIFAVSIGTVILPDLSGLASKKQWDDFNKMLVQAIKIITVITIPVTFYSLVTGKEMISLLYKNKMFDENSVAVTLGEFRFHIAGLFFIAVNRIITPSFYAQGNTKLPTLAGILCFGTNILLVLILTAPMHGNGIALALSLASMVNTIFLIIFMKKLNSFDVKQIVKNMIIYIVKIMILSVIAAIPCMLLRPILLNAFANHGVLVSMGMPIIILAIFFGAIGVAELIITKDEIVSVLIKKFKR